MENWKNLKFKDLGGAEFQLTHKTGKIYTIKILTRPKEGELTIANPKTRLSYDEFVMTEKRFNENVLQGNIILI